MPLAPHARHDTDTTIPSFASRQAERRPELRNDGPRIAVIGNHPPRQCGIASFTRDVTEGLERLGCSLQITAMCDRGGEDGYPVHVETIVDASSRAEHSWAGEAIERWRPDAVLVEHEYGIFGGPSGLWLLDMLDAIDAPVVTTLHTVLAEPNEEQSHVMARLVERSSKLIVMAKAGRTLLEAQDVPASRIAVIPHGAPDRAWEHPSAARDRLGWRDVPTLMTFGLLSPGKGIENVVDALPRILESMPSARYVLLGATHPHLLAREGERYRDSLLARAEELGVAHALHMIPRFVSNGELCDALAASDLYVTPYGNPQQITSGTLAYALALGKPILSTPYVHACEVLPPEQIVPHGDSAALGERVAAMLGDPERLNALSRRTWRNARNTVWSAVARRTLDVLNEASDGTDGRTALIAAE